MPTMTFAPKHILVPTDFSDCSKHALEAALSLAVKYDAAVSVVHVIEPARYSAALGHDVSIDAAAYQDVGATLKESAAEQMKEYMAHVTHPNVASKIENGIAYDAVCRAAEGHECDLIVIGTHGRSGLKRFVMGSVAEKVIRHAHCPVLTIR
jgi:universal stress protein A